jgi:hypothetical protein
MTYPTGVRGTDGVGLLGRIARWRRLLQLERPMPGRLYTFVATKP